MADDNTYRIDIVDTGTVTALPDKTLLESLESHKIDVQYHCREGFCGACRTRIIHGNVDYVTDPLAFIDDDEILPCCCVATSDIKIQIG
ncbi:class I ribonucleotide reductase maintenance protein YfaE [Alteromonas gilva]|uniref:Class I ribonucleotide reductase maintenance protein YfaE n=1 Tax=Alteromonas gilva TaxID=2987522 RepID=A0ABT5L438_9ALTE|nr:class I ribonucleotide reductase maintenance protein YfaE [Alteromonas gilva]MDC8831156.1 class I ribonucleotide reductase maintenance protein YfaE [Alteromonas gilva]